MLPVGRPLISIATKSGVVEVGATGTLPFLGLTIVPAGAESVGVGVGVAGGTEAISLTIGDGSGDDGTVPKSTGALPVGAQAVSKNNKPSEKESAFFIKNLPTNILVDTGVDVNNAVRPSPAFLRRGIVRKRRVNFYLNKKSVSGIFGIEIACEYRYAPVGCA